MWNGVFNIGAKAWLIVKEEEKRKQAEKNLEDRLRFEKFLTAISTKFINMSIDRLDGEIKAAHKKFVNTWGLIYVPSGSFLRIVPRIL